MRGTVLGSLLGILPGGGAVHRVVRRLHVREEDRQGSRRASAAAPSRAWRRRKAPTTPAAQTSFIPLLTLGIPPNAVMALMVGAMTIHGIVPGPQVMTKQPELFWGMIASMWIGNLMLLVINLPLVGMWVRLLRVPYRLLFPAIVMFCCIGIYSINNSPTDVMITALFGVVGYWLIKLDFEPAPMLLGFVLGTADGGEPAPRHADRARRCDRVLHAADLGRAADHRHHPARRRGAAEDAPPPRRGVRRVSRALAVGSTVVIRARSDRWGTGARVTRHGRIPASEPTGG